MALRIDFYNAIAKLLCYYEEDSTFEFEPTEEEKKAIQHMLDKLGRLYFAPPCTAIVNTPYQDKLFEVATLNPHADHENCPCVRSEKHHNYHRCKHGYYSD